MSNLKTGYTLAITIRASASQIWPWLVQVGQGRAGFYTYEWVENLLGANIHSADCILPALQNLQVGDTIRLTPDPYIGQPGQFMTVAVIHPERALVFKQTLPNGEPASWDLSSASRTIVRRGCCCGEEVGSRRFSTASCDPVTSLWTAGGCAACGSAPKL